MISYRAEVYRLVQDLHSVGIVHGDLEPRNVLRVKGGGFLLVDFSESFKHACKECKVHFVLICSHLEADIGIGWQTAWSSKVF
jgi:tRNA A-37 threonylcarbamoyl transferase component Bud32